MNCPGSVVLEAGQPDGESDSSREGSIAHALAAHCLLNKLNAVDVAEVKYEDKIVPVTAEMQGYVQEYLDYVWARAAGLDLMVEQRVELEPFTGEKGAQGTADAIVLADTGEYLDLIDLKYGANPKNKVLAENNEQLQMYALGAIRQFEMFGEFKKVRLHIHQPRLDHEDMWETDSAALVAFAAGVAKAVERIREAQKSNSLEGFLHPGTKTCTWCRAKAVCPALASQVAQATGADFNDVTQTALIDPPDIGAAMDKAELIEIWLKGVRAKAEGDLLNGQPVRGYKLVEGKKGNRDWTDDAAAEKEMKAMRLTQEKMYSFKLLTPTKIEKVLKNNPKLWARLDILIDRKPGKPSVAHANDPRPVYDPKPAADFSDASGDDLVDDDPLAIPKFLKKVK